MIQVQILLLSLVFSFAAQAMHEDPFMCKVPKNAEQASQPQREKPAAAKPEHELKVAAQPDLDLGDLYGSLPAELQPMVSEQLKEFQCLTSISRASGQELADIRCQAIATYNDVANRAKIVLGCGIWNPYLDIYDARSGKREKRIMLPREVDPHNPTYVTSLACYKHNNKQKIVVGHDNGTISIWDVETGTCDREIRRAHNGSVLALAIDMQILEDEEGDCVERCNAILSGASWDGGIRILNPATGEFQNSLAFNRRITKIDIAIVNNRKKIFCLGSQIGSGQMQLRCWDYELGMCDYTLDNIRSFVIEKDDDGVLKKLISARINTIGIHGHFGTRRYDHPPYPIDDYWFQDSLIDAHINFLNSDTLVLISSGRFWNQQGIGFPSYRMHILRDGADNSGQLPWQPLCIRENQMTDRAFFMNEAQFCRGSDREGDFVAHVINQKGGKLNFVAEVWGYSDKHLRPMSIWQRLKKYQWPLVAACGVGAYVAARVLKRK